MSVTLTARPSTTTQGSVADGAPDSPETRSSALSVSSAPPRGLAGLGSEIAPEDVPMSKGDAKELLQRSFAKIDALGSDAAGAGANDGKLSLADLKYASRSSQLTSEERAACGYYSRDAVSFAQLDMVGDGNSADGHISLAELDLDVGHTVDGRAPAPTGITAKRAADVLAANFGLIESLGWKGKAFDWHDLYGCAPDGIIGRNELSKAASPDSGLSKDIRDACRFFLEHPTELSKLDGANDGGRVDGQLALADVLIYGQTAPDAPIQATKSSMGQTEKEAIALVRKFFDLLSVMNPFGGEGMSLSRRDLEAASQNEAFSPELRAACAHLVSLGTQDLRRHD